MKKRVSRIRVNTKKSRSDMMLRNMLRSLLTHGKVETTQSRAKTLKRFADKEIAYAVKIEGNNVKNQITSHVGEPYVTEMLLKYREYHAKSGGEIKGSVTSLYKTRVRDGDNAEMAEVVLLDADGFYKYMESTQPKKKKKAKPKPTKKPTETKENKDEKKEKKSKDKKKEPSPRPQEKKGVPRERKGLFSGLGGRILGRKVQGPETGGKQGRSTARSGI